VARAAVAAETAGVPSVSIVCESFDGQAAATARGHGFGQLPVAITVGHVDAQSAADMERNFVDHTVDAIVEGLIGASAVRNGTNGSASLGAQGTSGPALSDPYSTVISGSIDQINDAFAERGWSDGLPIVPPTVDRVERFLAGSGLDPQQSLGLARTTGRNMTVWSVAANAVMAGCEPAHLGVLLAAARILANPHYGAEHSGNTTGADALMILDGPNAAALGFNSGVGALRDGVRANTSVGRWLRLYQRNVFGFTAAEHDKSTFGNSFRVVLCEDASALADIGWDPVSAEFGFGPDDDVLTMARFNSGAIVGSAFGSTPGELVPYLADGLARITGWDLGHLYGLGRMHYRPLLVLSPILARTCAAAGWTKMNLAESLFEHARIPAWRFEKLIGEWTNLAAGRPRLTDVVAAGDLPSQFAASDDPNRLVPIVSEPAKFVIAVAGDANRTNAYVFSHDGPHGDYTAAAVDQFSRD
jgi:hypothetical protein